MINGEYSNEKARVDAVIAEYELDFALKSESRWAKIIAGFGHYGIMIHAPWALQYSSYRGNPYNQSGDSR